MKRLAIPGLMALSVLLALACSLTSGIPTEEIRRRAIAILGDDVEEELVRDFIVVTPPPTFTVTPTPPPCINPVSFGTYNLTVFNDQSGVVDNPQFVYGAPDGRNAQWEGDADVTRYWSYSLANVISGMITHTLVYTPDETVTSVDLYVHPERFVSVDEPGWVRVCTGLWSCSFSAQVGSLMYALSGAGGVQVDGATIELTNGCEYAEVVAVANTPLPTLTPARTPTATIEISSASPPTAESTEAPTEVATPAPPPPTLPPLATLLPSPTLVPPSPTLPPPSPTLPPPSPTLPPPTAPPSSPPTDTPVPPPPPLVAFSAGSYSVGESGGSVTITVILNTSSGVPVAVNYTTSDGTATAGSDYATSNGTLTFSPGETSKTFSVSIRDDGSVEGDETVTLTLSSPTNALLGTPNVATLTILDDDVPTVQFSSATYSVNESAGTATITVTLNVPPVVAATVDYAISDGTATAGSEYAASSSTLTFNPGQISQSFLVTILNDLVIGEGNLVANLTLSNPTHATLGTPNPATLTMIDLCTLPDAITAANTDTATGDCGAGSGDDTITILLTGAINLTADLPNLSSNIVINGPGAGNLTIDGGSSFNIFIIDPGNTVTIDAVTVSNSSSVGILDNGSLTVSNSVVSGNLGSANGGGIINNSGALTLTNSTISGNSTSGTGGGIYNINGGTVTVDNSIISGNSATIDGGGIYNEGGTMNILNSTISGNTADRVGGVFNNNGTMNITNSTISGNTARLVSGIGNLLDTVNITNSTISGNSTAENGGGVANDGGGTVNLTHVTVTNNTADSDNDGAGEGGGVANYIGTFNLKNSLVAGNFDTPNNLGPNATAPDIFGPITSQQFNLIGNLGITAFGSNTTGDQYGDPNNTTTPNPGATESATAIDPLLGPLQNNGGPTDTHELLAGSPAIDAGSCPGTIADQRGSTRPVDKAPPNADDGCDIGAFEVQ